MLPGSDLKKIKEKNQQLVHIINLLNLHLNSRKKFKRSATSNFADEMPNLNGSMPSKKLKTSTFSSIGDSSSIRRLSTYQCSPKIDTRLTFSERMSTTSFESVTGVEDEEEKPATGEMAFKLRLLCDLSLVQRSGYCPDILRNWNDENSAICTFKRLKFANLLENEIQKLSREHAVIKATRKCNDGISVIQECREQDEMSGPIEEEKQQLEPSTVMSEENSQNSTKMIEEKQNPMYNSEYTLTDLSTNGTYYLKGYHLPENVGPGVEISTDFNKLSKNEQVNLEHGDIIGLIMKKPLSKKLVFGFQFLNK